MFNFEEMDNVTNKSVRTAVQSSDIIVMASNKIRLSADAATKIGLTSDKNILIVSGGGKLAITSTSEEKTGRPVNAKREFSHQAIAELLGGRHSEWAITGDGQEHPVTKDIYFELTETVNGKAEIAKLELKAEDDAEVAASNDLQEEGEVVEETTFQTEAHENADFSEEV